MGASTEPGQATMIDVESVLRSSNLKLLPGDYVSFNVAYEDPVALEPEETVIAINNRRDRGRRLDRSGNLRNLNMEDDGKVMVSDKTKEMTDKEDAEEPRLEVGLKTALCMAGKVYDDGGKEKIESLKPTCDVEAQIRAQIKVFTHMGEVMGPMNDGGEPEDVDEIVNKLGKDADKAKQQQMRKPRSKIEESLCLALDEMADAYFDQLYDNKTEDREDVCLTNACGHICKNTTTTVKKAFGGDCRFYCQCEAEAKKEMLYACAKGEIFINGACTEWKSDEEHPDEVHPQCADDDIVFSPKSSLHKSMKGSAAQMSVITITSLALLPFL